MLFCFIIIIVLAIVIDMFISAALEYDEYGYFNAIEGAHDFPILHIFVILVMFFALFVTYMIFTSNTPSKTVSDSGPQVVVADKGSTTKEYLYQIEKTQSKDIVLKWKKLDSSINEMITNSKDTDKNSILKILADCPEDKNRIVLETIIQCNPVDTNYLQKTYHDYLFECVANQAY
jgi:hypothetical protein